MTRHLPARLAVLATLAIVVLALLAHVQAQKPASQAELLLGKALNLEDVAGNLKDAIATYEQVLKAPDATRAQKARAQFRIGACYERLGVDGARKAYELVVANYGDMTDLAGQAKSRLATMGPTGGRPAGSGLVARLLWEDQEASWGAISPDGRLFAYDAAKLMIRNLVTGETRELPDPGDWTLHGWSPDGNQIAFSWYSKEDQAWQLRVVDVAGGNSRPLISTPGLVIRDLLDWFPDGKSVVVAASGKGFDGVAAVTLASGAIRELHRRGPDEVSYRARVSPDGRYLALAISRKVDLTRRNIVLIATDGSGQHEVNDSRGYNDVVGWTPDGAGLVFTSDRGGSQGLWFIGVGEGRAAGEPRLLKADIGPANPVTARVTRDGTVFYGLGGSTTDVMLAAFDPKTGTVVKRPERLAPRMSGATQGAAWSPDGRHAAFFSGTSNAQNVYLGAVNLFDVVSGQTASFSLPISVPHLSYPARWSSDGASVMAYGSAGTTSGLYRIDVRSGETTPVTQNMGNLEGIGGAVLSLDGKRLYYPRNPRPVPPSGWSQGSIYVRDLGNDQERELCRNDEPGPIGSSPTLATDGQAVAFYYSTGPASSTVSVLKVVSIRDGSMREIFRTEAKRNIGGAAWMPDGRSLAVSVRSRDDTGVHASIWLVPAAGGPATQTEISGGNMIFLSVHPDGKRLLYTTSGSKPGQLWALENILPPAKPGASKK